MRAWLLDRPAPIAARPLRLTEIPQPEPGPGEIRVRVNANALCRTDLHVIEGDLPSHRHPLVPGHQIAGTVDALGAGASRFRAGDRVGVPWLRWTCGACRFCAAGRENLCEHARFTGWDADGGYAEYVVAPEAFVYPLPDGFADEQAAPLLCAGIIGYRALALAGVRSGAHLGFLEFGSSAHVTIQVARARGVAVYVLARSEDDRRLATQLGATWTGTMIDRPPVALDAVIIFAPAGELVPAALSVVERGGVVVCAGIHMSAIPTFDYALLYGERRLLSVANNTRADGEAFLHEAAAIPVRTRVTTFPPEDAQEALVRLKHQGFEGAGVIVR
ncbi:MAG: zinc-dependent alcohol dehydrogenase family protein [Dehalococcoidia bacterium]